MEAKITRRKLIQLGAVLSAVIPSVGLAAAHCMNPTPEQTPGPFYPEKDREDKNNDLLHVKGHSKEALGKQIFIHGVVTDQDCAVVAGALVEIWQACESGRYNHSHDPNVSAHLDDDFQYWGQAVTDQDGRYEFLTILPGQYPANTNWMRPSHIHYKVHKRGYKELTTQMYFEGDQYNSSDLILQDLAQADQKSVIVNFADTLIASKDQLVPDGTIMSAGEFNLNIVKITAPVRR